MANSELVPKLEFVFAGHVTVDQPLDIGDVAKGGRRIVRLPAGSFPGRKFKRRSCRVAPTGRCCVTTALRSSKRAIRYAATTMS